MPELPEVEFVRRILEPQVKGLNIENVSIMNADVIAYPSTDAFAREITGSRINGIMRRGKFLQLLLDKGRITLHLRMTGCLIKAPGGYEPLRHTHLVFGLSDGGSLMYTDVRRFGRFWYTSDEYKGARTGIEQLGIEPDDAGLDGMYLKNSAGKRKMPVKQMLLDQAIIAGIGNIYSDEILFRCGINPKTPCFMLSEAEFDKLAAEVKNAISAAIAENDMTPEQYLSSGGSEYRNNENFVCYGRENKPCVNCGTLIERTVISGRSSCFCPVCQKVK